jgi:hypothetical protein
MQRKFYTPQAAISAAAVAVHPFNVSVAEIVSIRNENGTWGAILRLHENIETLPKRALERLEPFTLEQVAEPPREEDDWSDVENENHGLASPYFNASGKLKHGAIAAFVADFFSANSDATTRDCIDAGEAVGLPSEKLKGGVGGYRAKERLKGVAVSSPVGPRVKLIAPSGGWPSVDQLEQELQANPAVVTNKGRVHICRTAYPFISHYPRMLQVQALERFGVAAMTARTQMTRIERAERMQLA